ncbi:hypothetical protein METBIDRAFT_181970 [Metschnikowia bicuspidata var. bicuspidata NRRL YB-4993]|uniref:Uncharacterized protein n=1 Tax=Metschnikowia bicuspidata var. bicuspidata NRRL YB-4993 TaxID=869754 RepID=A0A1A0HBK7_9ASCO|nr:hypothetical protein METBIDRAFT_181970 [Metschnikowia bicuspidata var. bicuspidata NRRL YB-4993]OBA21370.1 hypothetical protein METBIDRAFT_181970 [Metschnikowia bicuspidata var. bicuspidata NRRL YB-4993]
MCPTGAPTASSPGGCIRVPFPGTVASTDFRPPARQAGCRAAQGRLWALASPRHFHRCYQQLVLSCRRRSLPTVHSLHCKSQNPRPRRLRLLPSPGRCPYRSHHRYRCIPEGQHGHLLLGRCHYRSPWQCHFQSPGQCHYHSPGQCHCRSPGQHHPRCFRWLRQCNRPQFQSPRQSRFFPPKRLVDCCMTHLRYLQWKAASLLHQRKPRHLVHCTLRPRWGDMCLSNPRPHRALRWLLPHTWSPLPRFPNYRYPPRCPTQWPAPLDYKPIQARFVIPPPIPPPHYRQYGHFRRFHHGAPHYYSFSSANFAVLAAVGDAIMSAGISLAASKSSRVLVGLSMNHKLGSRKILLLAIKGKCTKKNGF